MKICIVSNLYPPFVRGGGEIIIKRSAEEMVRRGHEIVVITTSQDSGRHVEHINGVKVYRIPFTNVYTPYGPPGPKCMLKLAYYAISLWSPVNYVAVRRILRDESPDVVHINNFKGPSLSSFSAARRSGIPIVFTAHDHSMICPRVSLLTATGEICERPTGLCRFYVRAQRYIANDAPDVVVSPSQFVLDNLRSAGFFKDTQMVRLPLGVPGGGPAPEKKYDRILILYVGGLSDHKGLPVLIKAFRGLPAENVRLDIIGTGKDEARYRAMASGDGRITFLGYIDNDRMAGFYRGANVTVIPSICYDNSPMVFYESIMGGTPVVGSRTGGIPELVEEGVNGLLFEPGDSAGLARLLGGLAHDPGQLKKLEEGAVRTAKKYTLSVHVEALERIYSGLAGGRCSGPRPDTGDR
jgi:glycosyltransferase involved in cell wall biosynthesis